MRSFSFSALVLLFGLQEGHLVCSKTCSSYPKVVASVGMMFSVLTTVCFCQAASNVDRMATFHVIARIQDQEAAEEGVRSRVCY